MIQLPFTYILKIKKFDLPQFSWFQKAQENLLGFLCDFTKCLKKGNELGQVCDSVHIVVNERGFTSFKPFHPPFLFLMFGNK